MREPELLRFRNAAHGAAASPSTGAWSPGAATAVRRPGSARALPAVPVLPATLLGFELVVGQRALSLRVMRDLLCADPGALLHLFALLGEEYPHASDRPSRLEDCIASLSAEQLLRAFADAGGARGEQASFARFAQHGAAIGRCAQSVADSLGLPGEQALLVGVLHELGTLPAVLGWGWGTSREGEPVLRQCGDLARRYRLPHDLCAALEAVHGEHPGSVWGAVIAAAHDLLGAA